MNEEQVTPTVGMGVTQIVGSDRYPYTVVEIVNDKTIVIQQDNAVRTDTNGISESQKYEYSPNKEGKKIVLTKRKYGRWREKGDSLHGGTPYNIGTRRMYQDPSF